MDTEGFEWLIPDLVESNNVTANAVCDELRILVLQKERHSWTEKAIFPSILSISWHKEKDASSDLVSDRENLDDMAEYKSNGLIASFDIVQKLLSSISPEIERIMMIFWKQWTNTKTRIPSASWSPPLS